MIADDRTREESADHPKSMPSQNYRHLLPPGCPSPPAKALAFSPARGLQALPKPRTRRWAFVTTWKTWGRWRAAAWSSAPDRRDRQRHRPRRDLAMGQHSRWASAMGCDIEQVFQRSNADGPMKPRLLLCVDETANTPMPKMAERAATLTGTGAQLVTVWQSRAQLDDSCA